MVGLQSVRDVASRLERFVNLRKANGKVRRAHPVAGAALLHAVQVQDQGPQRCIVGIRQRIDDGVQAVSPHRVIFNLGRLDEFLVMLMRQERVRKFPEELLQQAGNTIDVVEECFGVAEIDCGGIYSALVRAKDWRKQTYRDQTWPSCPECV